MEKQPAFVCAWGQSSRQGKRKGMEDVCVARVPYKRQKSKNQESFLAVFDGHGGKKVAQLAATLMPCQLEEELEAMPKKAVADILISVFATVDNIICQAREKEGTTATIIYLEENKAHLAWVGDSRAIIVSEDGTLKFATTDHTTFNQEERKRIQQAGGELEKDDKGVLRISRLMLTRALGDAYAKKKNPLSVINTPDTATITLENNDFIIVASDGLWVAAQNEIFADGAAGILNPKNSVKINEVDLGDEKNYEDGNDTRCKIAARTLRDAAFDAAKHLSGTDNISVMILQFRQAKQTSANHLYEFKKIDGLPLTLFNSTSKSLFIEAITGNDEPHVIVLDAICQKDDQLTSIYHITEWPLILTIKTADKKSSFDIYNHESKKTSPDSITINEDEKIIWLKNGHLCFVLKDDLHTNNLICLHKKEDR